MKKIKLWVRDVQRWNVTFMLLVGDNAELIKF